jgi:GNAT superfamily N-acetyltransferase
MTYRDEGISLKMHLLTPAQTATLKPWFLPDRPGPLVGLHVIHTGNGTCRADRWPAPRTLLLETPDNYTLMGDPHALEPADLRPHITGFVETSAAFVPLLQAAFPDVSIWPRVIFAGQPDLSPAAVSDYLIRRLEPGDTQQLQNLGAETVWISKTWGGPAGLATSGYGWGAFVNGQLAAVACTFFLGKTYEEIGVATEPAFRGLGLSPACVRALCRDIQDRGHQVSWTTSPDNRASIRVAEKLGLTLQRHDRLYAVGMAIPAPAGQAEG